MDRKFALVFSLAVVALSGVVGYPALAENVQTPSVQARIDVGLDFDASTPFPLNCEALNGVENAQADRGPDLIPVALLSDAGQTPAYRLSELLPFALESVGLSQSPSSDLGQGGVPVEVEAAGDLNGDLEPDVVFYFAVTSVFGSYEACAAAESLVLDINILTPEGPLHLFGVDRVAAAAPQADRNEPETLAAFSLGRVTALLRAHNRVVEFSISGQGVKDARVEVYALSGALVFDSGFVAGRALRWDTLDSSGASVANGVYLYVVTARSADGRNVRSEVKKVVILR